jgi:HNH endonuclease
MIVEYDCEVCGEHVRKKRSPANVKSRPRYCSQRCNGLARIGTGVGPTPNHTVVCEACGLTRQVYRSPSAPEPRFCSVQCTGAAQVGSSNPAFTGGRYVGPNGYAYRLAGSHPNADCRGYILEHRLVMESVVGRLLTAREVVHHVNRIKTDNRPENLLLLPSQAAHARLHQRESADV